MAVHSSEKRTDKVLSSTKSPDLVKCSGTLKSGLTEIFLAKKEDRPSSVFGEKTFVSSLFGKIRRGQTLDSGAQS